MDRASLLPFSAYSAPPLRFQPPLSRVSTNQCFQLNPSEDLQFEVLGVWNVVSDVSILRKQQQRHASLFTVEGCSSSQMDLLSCQACCGSPKKAYPIAYSTVSTSNGPLRSANALDETSNAPHDDVAATQVWLITTLKMLRSQITPLNRHELLRVMLLVRMYLQSWLAASMWGMAGQGPGTGDAAKCILTFCLLIQKVITTITVNQDCPSSRSQGISDLPFPFRAI